MTTRRSIAHRLIASFQSRQSGIVATVTLLDSGNYAVRVYDIDAEQTLPAARHYKTEGAAVAYAKQCAYGGDDNSDLPF